MMVARESVILLACVMVVVCSNGQRLAEKIGDRNMHPGSDGKNRVNRPSDLENTADFWINGARETLKRKIAATPNKSKAKNVILFLGDGMSIPTIAAARIFSGQKTGGDGEETELSFEKFPYTGLSKTYCVDVQVADSACSSNAYMSGVKNNEATLGVTGAVKQRDCTAMNNVDNHVSSIVSWAQAEQKATGVVTTTRVTHASPAAAYAHTAHRDWEADSDVLADGWDPYICSDIATQLINDLPGRDINVVLGGGRREFRSSAVIDEEGSRGYRLDRQDLIKKWEVDQASRGRSARYVWNKNGLLSIDSNDTEYLLGLFEGSHTKYHLDRDTETDPTLAEMTMKAIEVLQTNANGFFLFVEGGRIDHAHHDTLAQKALDETLQLALAVEMAVNMTNIEDTLIVVTSDHAHTMSIAGYPSRGSPILGITGMSDIDMMAYSTLSYANGPGYKEKGEYGSRYNMKYDKTDDHEYEFPTMVPLSSETHGGDDVAVFARGPWAHLFSGLYEQNYIPHAMAFASCIGNGDMMCDI